MGGAVLSHSALPDFIREGLAQWQRENALASTPDPSQPLQPSVPEILHQ